MPISIVDFDNDALKDTGSWSQAASLFYEVKCMILR